MSTIGAQPAGPLVSTAWLESNLHSPKLQVIDIRGEVLPPGNVPRYRAKKTDYVASHIPGARFLDWTSDIVDATDSVPMQIASEKAFSEAMARVGVGDDTLVVAYDDYKHIFAGRLAWALRYYGHDAAFVLDGGWSRWIAEGEARFKGRAHVDPCGVHGSVPAAFSANGRGSVAGPRPC